MTSLPLALRDEKASNLLEVPVAFSKGRALQEEAGASEALWQIAEGSQNDSRWCLAAGIFKLKRVLRSRKRAEYCFESTVSEKRTH